MNSNDFASYLQLAANTDTRLSGRTIYQTQCSICHRDDRTGSPPNFPSLVGVGQRLSPMSIEAVIRSGHGRMPAFWNLSGDEIRALVDYLAKGENKELSPSTEPRVAISPYRLLGYNKFLDPEGYPAVAPPWPWGTLNAINLNTGEYAWKIPLGEYPELVAKGMQNTGSENLGGPIVTAGGLLFIGATEFDKKFRSFDKAAGKLLWETTLPYPAIATPITYQVDGRQYVVIAAGGGAIYVAFALPKPK